MEESGATHSCRSSSMRRSLNSAMSKPATVSASSPPRGWKFDSSSMLSSSRSSSANSFSSSSSSSSSSPEPSEDARRYAEDDSMNVDDGSYEEDEEDCAGADAAADVDASVVIFGRAAAIEMNLREVGRLGDGAGRSARRSALQQWWVDEEKSGFEVPLSSTPCHARRKESRNARAQPPTNT